MLILKIGQRFFSSCGVLSLLDR